MGKRKETSEEDTRESSSSSPKKKHKHKHKKHKKKDKREHGEHEDHAARKERKEREKAEGREERKVGGLKLKIKLGGQTVTSTELPGVTKIVSVEDEDVMSSTEEDDTYQPSWPVSEIEEVDEEVDDEEVDIEADIPLDSGLEIVDESNKIPTGTKGNQEDLEEQKWLDALEAGELDDNGRIKQEKDISTMTARQRAMLGHEIEGENQLLELPTETRRKDEDSEEAQKRRKQRAKKRKQQMEKQIEENKAQTVQKLLTKQATRSKKDKGAKKKTNWQELLGLHTSVILMGLNFLFLLELSFLYKVKVQANMCPRIN